MFICEAILPVAGSSSRSTLFCLTKQDQKKAKNLFEKKAKQQKAYYPTLNLVWITVYRTVFLKTYQVL
jgi:hypothetical protein